VIYRARLIPGALRIRSNAIGRTDAIIRNAGVCAQQSRGSSPEGQPGSSRSTLAPYMLTALIERPGRLIYLSSGLHRGGEGSLADLDWTKRTWDPATPAGSADPRGCRSSIPGAAHRASRRDDGHRHSF
jgi:hypothetical protein